MARAQAENVIKNIIREIAQECSRKGQIRSETLVAFMVKAVVLDPDNGFNVERTLTKDDVAKLIELCVLRLMEKEAPALNTLQMQVYFDMNYTSREDFLQEHQTVRESRLQSVTREITDSRACTREELEILYSRIVSYILLRSGLGSPTDINVVREATAALQSIFPQSELGAFMCLSKREKERQLVELSFIVTGIRLFNHECGKGGEGIENIPGMLKELLSTTEANIHKELKQISNKASLYTDVLKDACLTQNFPSTIEWPKLKDAQINTRQHEQFVRVLMNDVETSTREIGDLFVSFADLMENVKATVSSKTAVPTSQVYPQFIKIAQIWQAFEHEMILLSILPSLLAKLQEFAEAHSKLFPEDLLAELLSGKKVKEQNESASSDLYIDKEKITNNDVTVLYPDSTKDFHRIPIHMKGFCPWSLHTYNGLLLPGNPSSGVIEYENVYYSFSSAEAAHEFASQPQYYIKAVADVAKKSPELIQLLDLNKQFAAITSYTQANEIIAFPVTKCEVGTQVVTHPIEMNIVKSYEWNEWELRRKALKLANLRKKITQSSQTHLSHYRRENVSQVYLPKEVATQSREESDSVVPKPSVFVAGLRGCNNTRSHIRKVDLTLDVTQT